MDSNEIDYKLLASKLRAARAFRNLTAERVESLGGPAASHLSRIENGHVKPEPETIKKLARVYRVSVAKLTNKEKEVIPDVLPE